jgi:hypothetical protein
MLLALLLLSLIMLWIRSSCSHCSATHLLVGPVTFATRWWLTEPQAEEMEPSACSIQLTGQRSMVSSRKSSSLICC